MLRQRLLFLLMSSITLGCASTHATNLGERSPSWADPLLNGSEGSEPQIFNRVCTSDNGLPTPIKIMISAQNDYAKSTANPAGGGPANFIKITYPDGQVQVAQYHGFKDNILNELYFIYLLPDGRHVLVSRWVRKDLGWLSIMDANKNLYDLSQSVDPTWTCKIKL